MPWITRAHRLRNTKSRRRCLDARGTLTSNWTLWYAFRPDAYEQSFRNITTWTEPKTRWWSNYPRGLTFSRSITTFPLAVLLLMSAGVILSLVSSRNPAQAGVQEVAPAAFRVFWNGFLSGQEEPWVIFSNAAFVGRPETGMRYYDNGRDKGS